MIRDLLEEERSLLKSLPEVRFDNSVKVPAMVRSTLTVQYGGVRYSVPSSYSGANVLLKVDTDDLSVYHCDKLIAKHKRVYSAFCKEVYDFRHYLPAMIAKPRALPNAKCIVRSNLPPIFRKYLDGLSSRKENGNREMVRILMLNKDYSLKDIFFAMEWCYDHRAFSYDAVVLTLKDTTSGRPRVEAIKKAYPQTQDMPLNIKKYDKLIGA